MAIVKSLRNLHHLEMHVKVSDNTIKLLNSSLHKENQFKSLNISFVDPSASESLYATAKETKPVKFSITFPKYLKHLTSLRFHNLCDPYFTETMFDMASARRLKELSLGFATETLSLPNFSEALSRFRALNKLELHQLAYAKINQEIFLDYLAESSLKKLSFSSVNFSDSQL